MRREVVLIGNPTEEALETERRDPFVRALADEMIRCGLNRKELDCNIFLYWLEHYDYIIVHFYGGEHFPDIVNLTIPEIDDPCEIARQVVSLLQEHLCLKLIAEL